MPGLDESGAGDFVPRRKLGRRLTLFFASLVSGVLLGGGASVYLSRSILLSAEAIRRESRQVDLAERIHSTIHHLTSAIQRAALLRRAMPESERAAYLRDLTTLLAELERQHDPRKEGEILRGLRGLVSELRALASKTPNLNPQELDALADVELRILGFAHLLGAGHRAEMDERLKDNALKMQVIVGLYAGFALMGLALVTGASFYFHRALAQPLKSLARAASEIAEGNFHKKVPVDSRDEIGQLSHAFNVMTERLKAREEALKGLATLEERERLAQELHDSLAQDLALLRLKVIELGEASRPADRPAATILAEMRRIVDGAYEDVRQAIFGLRTSVTRGLGFVPSLTEYLHDFSQARKIPVELKISGAADVRFSPQVEIQLIRIIHEALTNVFKHAQATRCEVRIEQDGGFSRVSIEDNGRGFRPAEVMRDGFHFGLQTMRKRAEGVGGSLAIDTAVGRGTTVTVRLPRDGASL